MPLSAETGSIEPPPLTDQLTVTPPTGLPSASVTRTTRGSARAVPTEPTWASPLTSSSLPAEPERAFAVKLTARFAGAPLPVAWARTRCWPAVGPKVQVVEASPSALVVALGGATWPPPASMAKPTVWFATGRSRLSLTRTTSA